MTRDPQYPPPNESFYQRFKVPIWAALGVVLLTLLPLIPLPWNQVSWAPTSGEWQAYAAVLGVLLTALAATIALVQLYSHLSSVDESRRPYVIADFTFRGGALAFVEVSNISANPAYDVTLAVDHPFVSPAYDKSERINQHFSSPGIPSEYSMPLLAPGRRVVYSLGNVADIHSQKLRMDYQIEISYYDRPLSSNSEMNAPSRFMQKKRRHWVEPNPLDLAQWSSTIAERDEYTWKTNESKKYLKVLGALSTTQQRLLNEVRNSTKLEIERKSRIPVRKISTSRRTRLRRAVNVR